MVSSRVSWRCSSTWLRRARLTKTPETPDSTSARSTAAVTAARWTLPSAPCTWPISSLPCAGSDASVLMSISSPARSLRMVAGSLRPASSSAELRSAMSSVTRPRPICTEISSEATTAIRPSSTAAPEGVKNPRAYGSVRPAASRPASVSTVRRARAALSAATDQRSGLTAAVAARPSGAAAIRSSKPVRSL